MPTFAVTIEQKTYHVDIPWLSTKPLQVIVDGQPLEISMSPAQDSLQLRQSDHASEGRVANKPVKAEWHASIRAE